MTIPTAKHSVNADSEILKKGSHAVQTLLKDDADALTDSGNGSRFAIQNLTEAYQELASRNAKNLNAAIQALTAVKNPAEFVELQQRLIKDGVEAAVGDSQRIAHLTVAVFTAAFEPMKKQIDAAQKTALN
jgi:hypothetical protein